MSTITQSNGQLRIEWIWSHMPILQSLEEEFSHRKPFDGKTIGICLHIEPKTAGLIRVLQAGGAQIAITGSPGTTQDDTAREIERSGAAVYGCRTDTHSEHTRNIQHILDHRPDLFLDNGADLYAAFLEQGKPFNLIGGTEETTSGANRLRSDFSSQLDFPILVINDSPLKRIVENEHGVGQTVVEGFMRATNLIVPAKRFVVIGYGYCGRGIARYLQKFGGQVTVVDINPVQALEAAMDGMIVSTLENCLTWGEVFITVTGHPGIIHTEHIERMQDGVILANAGHFSTEIDLEGIRSLAARESALDEHVTLYQLESGKKLYLLAGGEMINLASGKGNPAETMDMGLALQARSLERVLEADKNLDPGPQPVPVDINHAVARRMLLEFGFNI